MTAQPSFDAVVQRAAQTIARADALLICAGAGIGVDSGLPDFRGKEGFWRAYPPLAKRGLCFEDIANPVLFDTQVELAWGFYGHRLGLYRTTQPHPGFNLIRQWVENTRFGAFVYTSNVDGQFQRAGFDPQRIVECHGSLHHLQCLRGCSRDVWPAENVAVFVEAETLEASGPLPRCPSCGELARPNVLMFDDWQWVHERSDLQAQRMENWLTAVIEDEARLVVIEIGAGRAIPTVRWMAERITAAQREWTLIRINPREHLIPDGRGISIPTGALAALMAIDDRLDTPASP